MEVTRDNFKQLVPYILSSIQECTFIAIDGEYSGLQSNKNQAYFYLDSIQQRYEKLRDSAENFSLLQFGLTCFTWSQELESFLVRPFSFYLFSDPSKLLKLEKRFNFQASSAAFLAENRFDFNKVFHKGIQFLSRGEEKIFREKRGLLSKGQDVNQVLDLTAENKAFVDEKLGLIENWLQNSTDKELIISSLTSFQRLLIYQNARSKYGGNISLSKTFVPNPNDARGRNVVGILVQRCSQESVDAQASQELLTALNEQIGFRLVMEKLFERKCPLVLHNGILDLCHIYSKFIDNRLPGSAAEFKDIIHGLFPIIFDTKTLAAAEPVASLVDNQHLEELYFSVLKNEHKQFMDMKFIFPPPEIPSTVSNNSGPVFVNYLEEKGNFHDAAFDSFCTGYVFCKLMKLLGKTVDAEKSRQLGPIAIAASDSGVYANKLNLMRSDIGYFYIKGQEELPDRSALFYLSGRTWQPSDIDQLFGAILLPYRFYIVEDNAALFMDFSVQQKEAPKEPSYYYQTLFNIASTANPTFTVQSYFEYSSKLMQNNDRQPYNKRRRD